MFHPEDQTLDNWYEKLKSQNEWENVLEDFGKCSSDRDRVHYISQLDQAQKLFPSIYASDTKSAKESESFRTLGNQAFKKREYNGALVLYSKSLIVAPWVSTGSELALAFANRSAVLFYMEKYIPCLIDIKYAIIYGYPLNLLYKLWDRQNKCFKQLDVEEWSDKSFETVMEGIGEGESRREMLLSLLECQFSKCSEMIGEQTPSQLSLNFCHDHLPVKSTNNRHIDCASDALEICSSAERGRGIYATRDIEVGEVLIVEKPYSSVLLQQYNLSHCNHCCERVFIPFPCCLCSAVVYCSRDCQQLAWESYHQAECSYLSLIQSCKVGLGHLALRMVLEAKLWQSSNAEPGEYPQFSGTGMYNSSDYSNVYNLVNHTEQRSAEDLLKRTLNAVFLLKCLDHFQSKTNCLSEVEWQNRRTYIGGHILRNLQMLPCNAHEVSEMGLNANMVAQSQIIEIGSAIYATLSLINHSCDPSVVRHSYGDKCVVRAMRKVSKGQEIFDNYGSLYPLTVREERRRYLRPQYFFECSCLACTEDWPLYSEIPSEIPIFRCKNCSGSVHIPEDNETERAVCSNCAKVQSITNSLMTLAESDDSYREVLMKVLEGSELGSSIPSLVSHLGVLDDIVMRPWKDYNDCQEALKQCYAIQGNCYVFKTDT